MLIVLILRTHDYFVLKNGSKEKSQDRHGIAEYDLLQWLSDTELGEKWKQNRIER